MHLGCRITDDSPLRANTNSLNTSRTQMTLWGWLCLNNNLTRIKIRKYASKLTFRGTHSQQWNCLVFRYIIRWTTGRLLSYQSVTSACLLTYLLDSVKSSQGNVLRAVKFDPQAAEGAAVKSLESRPSGYNPLISKLEHRVGQIHSPTLMGRVRDTGSILEQEYLMIGWVGMQHCNALLSRYLASLIFDWILYNSPTASYGLLQFYAFDLLPGRYISQSTHSYDNHLRAEWL